LKVVAFNGSPRRDGNTNLLLCHVLKVLERDGIETELINLGEEKIHGCNSCRTCYSTKNRRCIIEDDKVNLYIQKMIEANGIIIGSPVYFSMMTPEMKAFLDRAFYVARANGDLFKRKVGAAVVAVRRAGGIPTFDAINHFFLISQMIVPGSSYWNVGFGRKEGEVENDEEAMKTMEALGTNISWLIKKLKK